MTSTAGPERHGAAAEVERGSAGKLRRGGFSPTPPQPAAAQRAPVHDRFRHDARGLRVLPPSPALTANPSVGSEPAPGTVATATEKATNADAQGPTRRSNPQITHETFKDAPESTDKSRTQVGVGEVVRFTADQIGTWSSSAGRFVDSIPGYGDLWKAPDRARSAIVTFKAFDGTASEQMSVIEPTGLTATRATTGTKGEVLADNDTKYGARQPGTNMWLTFKVLPLHVSFGYLEIAEDSGNASGVSGYFADYDYVNDRPRPPGSVAPGAPDEKAQATARDVNLHHIAKEGNDDGFRAVSAPMNLSEAPDEVRALAFNPPWSPGEFHWEIPNRFRVAKGKDESPADSKVFVTSKQSMYLIGTEGTMKAEKLTQTCSRFLKKP